MTKELPLAPRLFTLSADRTTAASVAEALAKQTGLEIDLSAIDGSMPVKIDCAKTEFWKAVDMLAEQTKSRVVIGKQGKPVRLVPLGEKMRNPVSIDGAFRVAALEVETKLDLQTGRALYDLTLDVAWEARLPIYRIESHPRILKGIDDAGRPITVQPIGARIPVSGVHSTLRFSLDGLNRTSKHIAVLEGTFKVTAAEEMLRFIFDDVTKPSAKKEKGVGVDLRKFEKDGTYWIADLHLHYPANSAAFESFETYWLGRNRLTLISPGGQKLTTDDIEINGTALRYRFKVDKNFNPPNLKGWKLEYETPGLMREAPVRFELKGIGLP